MSAKPQHHSNSKAQWAVGAVLYASAAVGLIFWLLVSWTISVEPGGGTFSVGTFTGSGLRDVLLATPTVLLLVASPAVLGVGLMRRRPWVRWFGLAYVLVGLLTAVLAPYLPPDSLVSVVLPLTAAVPTGVLVWRKHRGLLPGDSPQGLFQ